MMLSVCLSVCSFVCHKSLTWNVCWCCWWWWWCIQANHTVGVPDVFCPMKTSRLWNLCWWWGLSHDAHKRIALALKSNEFKSLRDAEWIHSNCYRDSVDHCNTLIILHTFALSLEAQYLPFQQILPTLTLLLIIGLPSSSQDWTRLIMLMSLFLFFFLLHFLFILCGRLIL